MAPYSAERRVVMVSIVIDPYSRVEERGDLGRHAKDTGCGW